MFDIIPIRRTDKFMLSSSGSESALVSQGTAEYNKVLNNPRCRVIEKTNETETEKNMNDKGVVISIIERLYVILTWAEDTL